MHDQQPPSPAYGAFLHLDPLHRRESSCQVLTVFLSCNVFNETFIDFDGGERSFDQKRVYLAGGHQFTPESNVQLDLLWQARSSTDFFRLQFYYTHNFDLRKQ